MRRLTPLLVAIVGLAACPANEPKVQYSLSDDAYWAWKPDYPGTGQGRVLVTNNGSDTISIFDLAKVGSPDFAELARVPVGLNPVEREGPHHVAADSHGEFYYVGISNYVPGSGSGPHGTHGNGTADGHVLKLRAADNLMVSNARVDPNPGDVVLTPDGQSLLLSHFDLARISAAVKAGTGPASMDARLAIIDPVTMKRIAMVTVCPAPHGIAVTSDSQTALLSCFSDELAIVTLHYPDYPLRRIPVMANPGDAVTPVCEPYAVTLSPDDTSAWVSCLASGHLLRYDVQAGAMDPAHDITLPGPAAFATYSKDGNTLVVAHQTPDGLAFLDGHTGAILRDVALSADACLRPHAPAFVDNEQRLLVACEGDHQHPGTVIEVKVADGSVEKVIPVGVYPDAATILRSGP